LNTRLSDAAQVVSWVFNFLIGLALLFPNDFAATFHVSIYQFQTILVAGLAVFLFLAIYLGLGYPTKKYTPGKAISFEASLDKTEYHLGDTMICYAKFKGNIDNGFFDAVLYPPGKVEPIYVYDRGTLEENAGPNTPGTLNLGGKEPKERKEHEDSWPCYLDPSWPSGDYIVQLVAFDHHFVGGRLREFAFYATYKLGRLHMLVPKQTVWPRDMVAKKEFKVKVLPRVDGS